MDDKTKQSKGGVERAKKLSPERRSEIARNAALVKSGGFKALHKGNFKEVIGVDIPCYVLNDSNHTAVMSQRGIAEALGFATGGGTAIKKFLSSQSMLPYIGSELSKKTDQPIVFKLDQTGSGRKAYGYDVTILIDICQAIIRANDDNQLKSNQAFLVKNASIILQASAKLGIRELVYKLAGYNSTKEAVIAAFRQYILEEARKWSKEFPDDLYAEWQRLYDIPVPVRGRNWEHYHLTLKFIYLPLAKSNGKLLALLKEAKKESKGKKYDKLHQFLNEIGLTALRAHIWQVVGIAKTSQSVEEYERRFSLAFGGQLPFEFDE